MTPGIAPDGARLCTSCAGMPGRSYFCLRCGAEGRRHRQGVCARCVLTDQLDEGDRGKPWEGVMQVMSRFLDHVVAGVALRVERVPASLG
jgi:hypothetical protein